MYYVSIYARTRLGMPFLTMNQGKLEEATEVRWQVLERSRKVLGPEHPDSLSRMFQLGLALHAAGERLSEAEQVFRQLLPLREKVLGPSHPDTMATMDAICEELFNLGKYEESRELLEEKLLRCTKAFGLDHQLTISTLSNIGNVYKMQRKFQDASSVYRTALDVSERAPSEAHQTTLIRNDLQEMQMQMKINLYETRKQTADSLELRQALAARHGLPIPADPFTKTRSITTSQLLDKYGSVAGVTTAGPEVAAETALRLAETTHHPLSAPVIIPRYYASDYTVPGPSQNHATETAR
jgi:tetratricopeptide (TPR) repeat protein